MHVPRQFESRPADEQRWLVENTWCDICDQADLGLVNPAEYEEDGEIYVSGACRMCGATVTSVVPHKVESRTPTRDAHAKR